MQLNPHKYSQTLLTLIGLSLLGIVLVLNHYHPRNQGIAELTHGSFSRLDFRLAGAPEVSPSTSKMLKSIQPSFLSAKASDTTPVEKIVPATENQSTPSSSDSSSEPVTCSVKEAKQSDSAADSKPNSQAMAQNYDCQELNTITSSKTQ